LGQQLIEKEPNSQARYEAYKAEETVLNEFWEVHCTGLDQQQTEFCKGKIENLKEKKKMD
jgi:hypothetical protein